MSASKREAIKTHLHEEIKRQRLRLGDKIPSQYELSERFGVNKLTANKAVAELVATGLLERRRGRGGTVVAKTLSLHKGVVAQLSSLSTIHGAGLLKGGQHAACLRGYACVYSQIILNGDHAAYWNWLREIKPLGIVSSGHRTIPLDAEFPTVYLDCFPLDHTVKNWVNYDNAGGGAELARQLLKMGRRNPVFIELYAGSMGCDERADSFIKEVENEGIPDASERIFRADTYGEINLDIIWARIKHRFPNVDAIALDVSYDSLRDLVSTLDADGRRVPEDVSVAGFGMADDKTQNLRAPTLMNQNFPEAGFRAMNHLIDLIEGKQTPPIQEILPMTFRKGSTAARERDKDNAKT